MKTVKKTINNKPQNMPYINFNSPDLKKELQKMDDIIRNLKQPLPFK
jgi:hypothetical protein